MAQFKNFRKTSDQPNRTMKIVINTKVQADYKTVFEGFNENLFTALAPPFPKMHLMEFGGTTLGMQTYLILDFVFFKEEWISVVTEEGTSDQELYFVDEGTKLPFFLAYWHHEHRIIKEAEGETIIQDFIVFKTPNFILDFLMYPALFFQFLWRKPIYKRIFNQI